MEKNITAKLQSLENLLEDKLKEIEGRLKGELKCTILLCIYHGYLIYTR
jgi:hypothetical protein